MLLSLLITAKILFAFFSVGAMYEVHSSLKFVRCKWTPLDPVSPFPLPQGTHMQADISRDCNSDLFSTSVGGLFGGADSIRFVCYFVINHDYIVNKNTHIACYLLLNLSYANKQ